MVIKWLMVVGRLHMQFVVLSNIYWTPTTTFEAVSRSLLMSEPKQRMLLQIYSEQGMEKLMEKLWQHGHHYWMRCTRSSNRWAHSDDKILISHGGEPSCGQPT